jgi:hypothetical protein
MRSTRHTSWPKGRSVSASILLLTLILLANNVARAADNDEAGDEYDVKARVVRISLLEGAVELRRNGNTDWEPARINFALVEGDTIATTTNDARVEIQIDARNFVRLGANSVLKIVTLRDEGVALSLVAGTASLRLAKFDPKHEYFEIDAPQTTLAAEKSGLYRVDVSRTGTVRLAARAGGRARIYSETSGFTLRDGRTAELVSEGANAGDWEFVAASDADSWDSWVDERERYLAQRLRYDVQYYDSDLWGAEDLEAYGDWIYAADYGWVWRPHPTVISSYHDWAPYRYGSWVWVSPYGWTWVGYEPWGWAPYHYGRWVYYNNYWAWCPRSLYHRQRSWWRPALVAFSISLGNDICWYPLPYHHRDPRSRNYHGAGRAHDDRLRPLRADEIARLQRINPAYYRAVTAQSARDFGSEGARLRAADDTLARRAISAEPLRTDLPVRPAHAVAEAGVAGNRSERITVARPARVAPPRETTDRPTGAAQRSPGVALDAELRRTRILNGREALPARLELPTPAGGAAGEVEPRPTGAVARPARARETEPRGGGNRAGERVIDEARPTRVERKPPQADAIPESGEPERTPARAPVRPTSNEAGSPADRPARAEGPQPPSRERNDRVDQPTRSQNSAPTAPTYRPDPPARSEPPPRNDPPARSEPPPRNDPPARSEPPPRNDPPARSEPPPRNDPPARSEPPPRNDPPARSEPQRSESREDRTPAKVKDPR